MAGLLGSEQAGRGSDGPCGDATERRVVLIPQAQQDGPGKKRRYEEEGFKGPMAPESDGGCQSCKQQGCTTCGKVFPQWQRGQGRKPYVPAAPTFYPSKEEFADMAQYIASIRSSAEPFGLCKIVPPSSWQPPAVYKDREAWLKHSSKAFNTRLQEIHKLQVRQPSGSPASQKRCKPSNSRAQGRGEDGEMFGYRDYGHMTLREFAAFAEDFKHRYFRHQLQLGSLSEPSLDDIEAEFWRIVEAPTGDVEVLYGADVDSSDMGSGFPSGTTTRLSRCPWNLLNLARSPASLLSLEGTHIPGVLAPWLYFGMAFSAFCWHVEDHHLYSINYLHGGAAKVWYGVPGYAAGAFEASMRRQLPALFAEDPQLLSKLVTMLSPSVLLKDGVPVSRLVQREGDFVVTFPGAYHAGFNAGLNCAEASNFAPACWLPHGQAAVEQYQQAHRKPTLAHDKLLLEAARAAVQRFPLTVNGTSAHGWTIAEKGRVSPWRAAAGPSGVLTSAVRARSRLERERRAALQAAGVTRAERMGLQFEDVAADLECTICCYELHLSAVRCSCTPGRLSCLEHAQQLCDCPLHQRTLLYRWTLAELHQLDDAVGSVQQPEQPPGGGQHASDGARDAGAAAGRALPSAPARPGLLLKAGLGEGPARHSPWLPGGLLLAGGDPVARMRGGAPEASSSREESASKETQPREDAEEVAKEARSAEAESVEAMETQEGGGQAEQANGAAGDKAEEAPGKEEGRSIGEADEKGAGGDTVAEEKQAPAKAKKSATPKRWSVECNGVAAEMVLVKQRCLFHCQCASCQALSEDERPEMTPNEFELHAGSRSKKWRTSIRAISAEGARIPLGKVMEDEGLGRRPSNFLDEAASPSKNEHKRADPPAGDPPRSVSKVRVKPKRSGSQPKLAEEAATSAFHDPFRGPPLLPAPEPPRLFGRTIYDAVPNGGPSPPPNAGLAPPQPAAGGEQCTVSSGRVAVDVELVNLGRLISRPGWWDERSIFPGDYRSAVSFYSTRDVTRKCLFFQEIVEAWDACAQPGPIFKVIAEDRPHTPFMGASPAECWAEIQALVNNGLRQLRQEASFGAPHKSLPLAVADVSGLDMFGLTDPAIIRMVEALDPHRCCHEYWRRRQGELGPTIAAQASRGGGDAAGLGRDERLLRSLFDKGSMEELQALARVFTTLGGTGGLERVYRAALDVLERRIS